jgi:hypothetical protein
MAQTGAASASDSIRQQIAADNSNKDTADESFTDQLLFNTANNTGDAPLNADAEKARLDAGKNGQQPSQQQSQDQKTDSGWLDGIF